MSARFSLARRGDLRKTLAAETAKIERGATLAVARAGGDLQRMLRSQVRRAKLGKGLEKAWGRRTYPRRGASMNAAALITSRAQRLHTVFSEGATIKAKSGKWLALPTDEARARGLGENRGRSLGNRPRRGSDVAKAIRELGARLAFIRLSASRALLVDKRPGGQRGPILFVLVRQVTIRRRLDPATPHRTAAGRIAGYLARELAKP